MADVVSPINPNSPEFREKWAKIVARSWADPELKRRLRAEPKAVLAENGIALPEGQSLDILDSPPDLGTAERLDGGVRAVAAAAAPASATGYSSGGASASPGGGGMPPTAGWQACIGTTLTGSLCFSGAAP